MTNIVQALLKAIASHWTVFSLISLTLITIFSLIPLPELPDFPGNDKTHHFVAYGLLMFPVALRQPKQWLLIACFFIGWSGAIELIQPYVNRYGEWFDLLANVGGVLLGAITGIVLKNLSADRF